MNSQASSSVKGSLPADTKIITCDMHTGGEPVRIVVSGYPAITGDNILAKRSFAQKHLDQFRRFVMHEPRGHKDMYGAILVKPDNPSTDDFGVLFIHNEGYSTMCGHAVIALGRYAVDHDLVKIKSEPQIEVCIRCPCGMVRAFVEYQNGQTGSTRFHSVPAFVAIEETAVQVPGYGKIVLDVAYGGAFYAIVDAKTLGLDVETSSVAELTVAGTAVTKAAQRQLILNHPDSVDLEFIYGTIITDGQDRDDSCSSTNICIFADAAVDRSPTGSGVTARIALQFKRGYITIGQKRMFRSKVGSMFGGKAVKTVTCGSYDAVIVEVSGQAYYTGTHQFILEKEDPLQGGFLLA